MVFDNHKVLGLEIAVNDALIMDPTEPVEELRKEVQCFGLGESLVGLPEGVSVEGFPVDPFHDQVQSDVFQDTKVVNLYDIGAVKIAKNFNLS